jgi:inositol-pentakisphosphate 2-kinase
VQISGLSKYSPLDLFSGNTEGIHKALLALFETPQNNLRIFMDGVEIFGGPEDGGSTEEAISILEEQLQRVSAAPKGQRVVAFQRLVAHMLHTSKILESLLCVQQLDEYDIEGAFVAYQKFLKPDADTGKNWPPSDLHHQQLMLQKMFVSSVTRMSKSLGGCICFCKDTSFWRKEPSNNDFFWVHQVQEIWFHLQTNPHMELQMKLSVLETQRLITWS